MVRDRTNPDAHKRYARVAHGTGAGEARALDMFKTANLLEPAKTREYITVMVLAGLTDEEIRSALPEQADAYIVFANYLEKTGNDHMASEIYTDCSLLCRQCKRALCSEFSRCL